jgi:hypothetical protein
MAKCGYHDVKEFQKVAWSRQISYVSSRSVRPSLPGSVVVRTALPPETGRFAPARAVRPHPATRGRARERAAACPRKHHTHTSRFPGARSSDA